MIVEHFDFHSVFALDADTGILRWKSPPKNHAEKLGAVAGYTGPAAPGNKHYWAVRAFGKTFKRSRVVFYMLHGRWPTPAVDHINGDSLDDRPNNLRECTLSQNGANSRRKPRKYDLPRGVYLTKQGRYMARLTVDGRSASLGCFDTPGAALDAYALARKEAFGEFA